MADTWLKPGSWQVLIQDWLCDFIVDFKQIVYIS